MSEWPAESHANDPLSVDPILFTGLTVCFNDAAHLSESLASLKFCDELIVIDLGSTDDSPMIAKNLGARVISHPWVPIVEDVREFAARQASRPWIAFLDPDLICPPQLPRLVKRRLKEDQSVGLVYVAYQNWFGDRILRRGRWGGVKSHYPCFFHADRVEFRKGVHSGGVSVKSPFQSWHVPQNKNLLLKHHWVESWAELSAKCRRYFVPEAQARLRSGRRTSRLRILSASLGAFLNSLIIRLGFLEGWLGIRLSLVAGWYEWEAEKRLFMMQSADDPGP